MADYKAYEFVAGDILLFEGETYQVHESLGTTGLVSRFPSIDVDPQVVDWNDDYRKIGHEPLPAPTPCAITGDCTPPSASEVVPIKFVDS
ncbi:MAG: hypothetical protein QGF47_08780 [Arenicellales bacterium]|jgi:hypothetical protein|nr:hypothetical protein [Pseudomonadales bacterium]MDP6267741.1 hypothetical protein [Arenicellales bacterium]MDP7451949.1 hypothetical protein [Arenicellales bacterium]|tara:strand:- start:3285 stop:3554 length:270 start_codon:yes stop_codon:yes gene_type:complete